jgi:hypothetical protein
VACSTALVVSLLIFRFIAVQLPTPNPTYRNMSALSGCQLTLPEWPARGGGRNCWGYRVLPDGVGGRANGHRIRHYSLFAGTVRARNIERPRELLAALEASTERSRNEADSEAETPSAAHRCPCCGRRMIIVETFEGARPARSPSPTRIRIDTS